MPPKIVMKHPSPPEPEIPVEVLAEAVVAISAGFRKIEAGPLARRTLVLLINDATGVGKCEINRILNALPELERLYLKKPYDRSTTVI